jgi:hypothetical protein
MGDRLRIIFGGLSWRPDYFEPAHDAASPEQTTKTAK